MGSLKQYFYYDFPFAQALIVVEKQKMLFLGFTDVYGREAVLKECQEIYGNLEEIPPIDPCHFELEAMGTPFQISVWKILLEHFQDRQGTYSDVASLLGAPKSVRAVASAIGRNPISYYIPCHNILRRDGSLGGYRWGLDVKKALLESSV